LKYQWRFNGTNISNAITSTLILSGVQANQAGAYDVVVTNGVGSVTSVVAILKVLIPPSITLQPLSLTVPAGSNATFTVSGAGDPPLTYQWRFNGTNLLAGQTNASLILTNVQTTNTGSYSVTLANGVGNVTSSPATLSVLLNPPLAQARLAGLIFTLTFASQNGVTYIVDYKDTVTNAAWTALSTNIGTGGVLAIDDPTTNSPMRFYRVRIP
jgi:hypothetical protein